MSTCTGPLSLVARAGDTVVDSVDAGARDESPVVADPSVWSAPPPQPAAVAQITQSAAAAGRFSFAGIIKNNSRIPMLAARELTKEYQSGDSRLAVLRNVTFDIPQGTFVSIVGPSGSGKTTLLGLLAGLDIPSGGTVLLDGADLTRLDEDARAKLRGEKVGFIFQSFQLIPTLTAAENVQVPLELRGDTDAAERARDILARVGLGDRTRHFPNQLSGGEQQRVAIARAFANQPRILFADEPTGNLDGATGARIVELLDQLNQESGATVVIVTHDLGLAEHAKRVIRLKDGEVVEDRQGRGFAEAAHAAALVAAGLERRAQ
jgi:putative ABC transport system ATP-binding protein